MYTIMQKFTAILFLLFSITLAAAGAWLLLDSEALLAGLHNGAPLLTDHTIVARQMGLGLLLAAGINLYCFVRQGARGPLHLLVLFYLAGLVASHGAVAFGKSAWMWMPVAIYALPLLLAIITRLPKPSLGKSSAPLSEGEHEGEVKWFNPNKGFGFLTGADGEEIFVHFKSVQNGGRRSLRQGQKVRFTTKETERGTQADEVHIER